MQIRYRCADRTVPVADPKATILETSFANQQILEEFGTKMAVGIGIHLGTVIVGRLGHPTDQRFAIVGDAVDVASRIEGMNKELGTRLLVSEDILAELPEGALLTGRSAPVSLKGTSSPLGLHEVVGFRTPDPTLLVQTTLDPLMKPESRFSAKFYRRLFAAAPDVRRLFTKNLAQSDSQADLRREFVIMPVLAPEQKGPGICYPPPRSPCSGGLRSRAPWPAPASRSSGRPRST